MFRSPFSILGVLVLGYYLLQSGKDSILDGFSVESVPIRGRNTTLEKTIVEVDLKVKNENFKGANVQDVLGSLIYGTASLAALSLREPIEIPARGIVLIPIRIEIIHLKLFADLLALVTSGSFLNNARAAGMIQLDNGLMIPFDLPLVRFG